MGNTALHYAAESGHNGCFTFLVDGCSDSNVTNQVNGSRKNYLGINV